VTWVCQVVYRPEFLLLRESKAPCNKPRAIIVEIESFRGHCDHFILTQSGSERNPSFVSVLTDLTTRSLTSVRDDRQGYHDDRKRVSFRAEREIFPFPLTSDLTTRSLTSVRDDRIEGCHLKEYEKSMFRLQGEILPFCLY
jgi:hypothetical protein